MVLCENAIAEQNSAASEFYASLPREKSLLCCVCHESNTTFRYEVIYKNDSESQLNPVTNQVTLTTSIGQVCH